MEEDKKLEQNLDKSDEKLHISDVRNSIQERIKGHKNNISSCLELIQTKTDVIINLSDSIRNSEIRITELELVLEYCF
jgi:predicted S18 family serine protease